MLATGVVAAAEDRALIRRRQKTAVEIVEPAGRNQAAVEHDEARQIPALAAQAVASPRRPCSAGPAVPAPVCRK